MWLVLSFLTALFTSFQDILSKKALQKADVYIVAWAGVFFTLPFLYAILFVKKIPDINSHFWPAIAVSTVVLVISSLCYVKAMSVSDLSLVMPILTFTPLFLLVTSPLILGESPSAIGLIGIFLIVSGSYFLYVKNDHKQFLDPIRNMFREKGARYMLAVAVLFSIGANVDKIGINSGSVYLWSAVLFTSIAAVLSLVMLQRTYGLWNKIKDSWPWLLGIGFCNTIALLCNMLAIKYTLVSYVIAIKRLSVVITALFGFLLFKEQGFKNRFFAILIMVLGVLLISLTER